MRTISRKDVIFQFSPENQPVASVEAGESLLIETDDCFRSQLKSEKDLVTEIDFSKVNPATGPIEIKGAVPGDLLVVDILDIQVESKGFMVAIPGEGVSVISSKIRSPSWSLSKTVNFGLRQS